MKIKLLKDLYIIDLENKINDFTKDKQVRTVTVQVSALEGYVATIQYEE